MTSTHRVLVCGAGAIGERHVRNLTALGVEEIALYRRRGRPLRTVDETLPTFVDWTTALAAFEPTIAFVTNPTSLHVPCALAAADAGCHVFIEKPLSHTLEGIDELGETLRRHDRLAMVGYMQRFHPLLRRVQAWLAEEELGAPLFVRAAWGEHVPDWHPWEDYRTSYAVREELGGGPALTLSHELDVLVWLFGPARSVSAQTSRNSPLEAACAHACDLLLRFDGGVTANVHLDYVQRPPHRSWELVCSDGRVALDLENGWMRVWRHPVGARPRSPGSGPSQASVHRTPEGYDRNDMFLDEAQYFLDCIERHRAPSPSLGEAAESVRIALAATAQEDS